MKVLIIGASKFAASYGGGEVYSNNLVIYLGKNIHQISYLSLSVTEMRYPRFSRHPNELCDEYDLALPSEWIKRADHDQIINAISHVFERIKPDVIHTNAWASYSCLAARLENIPVIVTAHHGGIVCPAGALLNADDSICQIPATETDCLKCCTKSVPGWQIWFPLIRTIPLHYRLWLGKQLHRLPFILFLTPLGKISCSIRDKIQSVKEIGQAAVRIIAPSPAIATALVRNGIPEQKIVVVPHGIPLLQHKPLRDDLANGPIRFLFVGRINRVKGLHIMLEAFSGLSADRYELQIVGGAVTKAEQRYLSNLRKRYKTLNVVWHGSIAHDEIAGCMAKCDVTVHPAIVLEVFGLTIAESLAVGRPVIATRCGGAEAQIRDGKNGLLVPPNDAPALRTALQRIIDNPDIIKEMTAQTGDVISIEQHVQTLEQLYTELQNKKD